MEVRKMKEVIQEVTRCNVTHYSFAVSNKGTPGSLRKGLLWKGCKKESRFRAVPQRKKRWRNLSALIPPSIS